MEWLTGCRLHALTQRELVIRQVGAATKSDGPFLPDQSQQANPLLPDVPRSSDYRDIHTGRMRLPAHSRMGEVTAAVSGQCEAG